MITLMLNQLTARERLSQRTVKVGPFDTATAQVFDELLIGGTMMRLLGHVGDQKLVGESLADVGGKAGFRTFCTGGLPVRSGRLTWRMGLFGQPSL